MLASLTFLAVIFAAITIRGKYSEPRALVYIFKPLTMVSILLIALSRADGHFSFYVIAVLAGMLLSMVGDALLMLPFDLFLPGLVSFLLAHICYIGAFVSAGGFGMTPKVLVPYMLYAALVLWLLWPHLGKMRAPVLAYMGVIMIMGWQAGELWRTAGAGWGGFAAVGGALFILSDSILALDRFRKPFRSAQALLLTAYFAAQWFLAMSVHP